MKNCLDEGMLQSYLDGELSPELSARAATHIGACDACADALGVAGEELALFARSFAPDASLSVPTEALRGRLDAAIAGIESPRTTQRKGTFWNFGALAAWLAAPFNFEPRMAGAFASIVALVALAAIFGSIYFGGGESRQPVGVAQNTPAASAPSPVAPSVTPSVVENPPAPVVTNDKTMTVATNDVKRSRRNRAAGVNNSVRVPKDAREDVAPAGEVAVVQQSVPGEENYLRTIASLSKVVELGGPDVLRPQVRASYERNIVVIDKAIV
ncbi:MAG TPA: zf-HC2 domain-containing protein, partial [Pyrinomonadaceae bacterium]